MYSRRDFLKAATALGSTAASWSGLPESVARAFSIDPEAGSTFMDAEHVVILMQENRSFDHTFGSLQGVRGFRDPRVHRQPNGEPVWFQPDTDGKIVPPFRLDIDHSNVTWIGGTPHSWSDQVDAYNGGRYDKWLPAKRRGDGFPMTMGFFTREDISFYYALADAFTICDQAFCSSLTGTTPNRLYLWTGTIREDASHPARVSNGDTDYDSEAAWTTFPERLEDAGVSWKIYQNEVSIESGLYGEHDAWLANFTDNPIEWFSQFRIRFSPSRRRYVTETIPKLERQIDDLKSKSQDADQKSKADIDKQTEEAVKQLASLTAEHKEYTEAKWSALPAKSMSLHKRAFCDNRIDPNYRELDKHAYDDHGTAREIDVPKGDALAQFRADVASGNLPRVSWMVPSERLSDHPASPWFGAWYLSEAINILTADPEVWKKTVFILCYDENDGLFDHVPPFIAPHPDRPETGKTSSNIDTAPDISKEHGRNHSIGLGYRVPLVVVSPWTRGGCVNSQVFDHTSVLMFLEKWLAGKSKDVRESNISTWRRTVSGDLTSVFRPYNGEKLQLPKFLERDPFVERIHNAKFQGRPVPPDHISASDTAGFDVGAFQERGTRPSCPLPYELEASISLGDGGAKIKMSAGEKVFGKRSSGSAFKAYSYGAGFVARAYAVSPGDSVVDSLPAGPKCLVRIDGPNGFVRQLEASQGVAFSATARARGTELVLTLANNSDVEQVISLQDGSYGQKLDAVRLRPMQSKRVAVSTEASHRWYDVVASHGGASYRFSGRIENGAWSVTDPAMA